MPLDNVGEPSEGAAPTAPADNDVLAAALEYARRGWSVVPVHVARRDAVGHPYCTCSAGRSCISPGKHPAVSWTRWQRERADEAQLRAWFAGAYAGYGVGLITGGASGFFVVDVDEGEGKPGAESLQKLQMENDDLPHTVTASTGGGGRHLLFRQPDGVRVVTAKNVLGRGVDVRGDGGFIVAPPSSHLSGRAYAWDAAAHPATTGIATAPEWLVELVREDGIAEHKAGGGNGSAQGEVERNCFGLIVDGREAYMVNLLMAQTAEHVEQHDTAPTPDHLFASAWSVYSRAVKTRDRTKTLEQEGRGETLMRDRVAHVLRMERNGQLRIVNEIRARRAAALSGSTDATAAIVTPARLPLVWAGTIKASADASDFVEGLLTDGAFSVMYGDSNLGKTFLTLDLAYCVALGAPWRGLAVDQGGVVYCALEGKHGITNRIVAIQQTLGLADDSPRALPLGIVTSSVNLLDPNADAPLLIETIRAEAETIRRRMRLVVIDTLSRALAGGNENASEDMGALVKNADAIRHATGAHLLFVHHTGKDAARGARGHSLLRAATDTEIELSREGNNGPTVVKITKQRDLEPSPPFSFTLRAVPVGVSRRGKQITSCIVEYADAAPTATGPKLSPKLWRAYQQLRNALCDQGQALPHGPKFPMSRGVKESVWREYLLRSGETKSDKPDSERSIFSRIRNELKDRGVIRCWDDWVWITEITK